MLLAGVKSAIMAMPAPQFWSDAFSQIIGVSIPLAVLQYVLNLFEEICS
jgi:hypothetical protein